MITVCRKCSTPISPGPGPGRPPSYCSTGCRRAAEREIRRLDEHIASAERELTRWRAACDGVGHFQGLQAKAQKQRDWWVGELARREARLTHLLETAPPTPTSTEDA